MQKQLRILSPCGILGYGFPKESFLKGIEKKPDAIIVDAGSTDAGPHKLGNGVSIVSERAAKKDLEMIIKYGCKLDIPVIIGSAGGAGARKHVNWTLKIIDEILRENDLQTETAVIWSDIPKERVRSRLKEGKVIPLGKAVKPLTEEVLDKTGSIVAQIGHEPIVEALKHGSKLIVCGRTYDPAIFAAFGIYHGFDAGLAYHMGKILECGALCAEPGTTKDCILGTLYEDCFRVEALNENRRCTPTSVAAHTFYEKAHPYILNGPGYTLDLSACTFTEVEKGVVEVRNSKLIKDENYTLKLEGARKVANRACVIAGVRDPLMIAKIDEIEAAACKQVAEYYTEIPADSYKINFYNYGKNGVMGDKEIQDFSGYEIGVLFEVIAENQELANSICASVRSTLLHYGYEGRKSTAGNLAFPFAPSDIPFGDVFEFSVYHLMIVDNGLEDAKIEYMRRPI